jgi:hypothetical protein
MKKFVADRVAVFFDYENVHRTGHESFVDAGTPIYKTVVNPIEIAERLVARRKFASELVAIYVFRGRPAPTLQPKPASANDIQAASWSADTRVRLVRRDLKYAEKRWQIYRSRKGNRRCPGRCTRSNRNAQGVRRSDHLQW